MSRSPEDRRGRIAGRHVRRLLVALREEDPRSDVHLSALAEALVAQRMLGGKCTLEFEARTPSGRHADFRVERDGIAFFAHVKRLLIGHATSGEPLPPALAGLAALPRPLTVAVRWNRARPELDLLRFAEAAQDFLLQASVGDELDALAPGDGWLGHCRVLAPHAGVGVDIRVEDGAEAAAVPRAQRLLRRAFSQFMPGAENTVCVVGDTLASALALETALLGTVIERWDRFPPKGRRTAHGRADDGFWAGGRYAGCNLVAWLPLDERLAARLWTRGGTTREPAVERVLRDALGLRDEGEVIGQPGAEQTPDGGAPRS